MPIEIKGLDQEIDKLIEGVEGVVRDMAAESGRFIIAFSPVLTGFFITNWNDSIGGPDTTVRGTRPNNVNTRQFSDPTFSVQETWNYDDGDIVFANSVEYAEFLDAGSSPQSEGVTDQTAAIVDTRFRRVVI